MLELVPSESQKFIGLLLEIKEEVCIALEAAAEQVNLLSAISYKPHFLIKTDIEKVMTNYSNQIHQMKLLRQQCAEWMQTKNDSESHKPALFELEFNSIKLERLSEKIIFLLRYIAQATEPAIQKNIQNSYFLDVERKEQSLVTSKHIAS